MTEWIGRHATAVWFVILVLGFASALTWQEQQITHLDCTTQVKRWIVVSTIIDQLTAKPGTHGLPPRPPTSNHDLIVAAAAADARLDLNRSVFVEKLGPRPKC